MALKAYVLVEAAPGRAAAVGSGIRGAALQGARILGLDLVTGPYDLIVQVEADDLSGLGRGIVEGIQRIEGVQRTTTCLAVTLS